MKTLYKSSLLSPDSTEGFQAIKLSADKGAASNWSVKSYTLRGGLQEGVQVVEVNNGKLSFAILPTRGMGIWKGQCGDIYPRLGLTRQRPCQPCVYQPAGSRRPWLAEGI